MSRPKGIKEHGQRAKGGGRPPEKLKYIETDPGNRIQPEHAQALVKELLEASFTGTLVARVVPPVVGIDDLQQDYRMAVVVTAPKTSLLMTAKDLHRLALQEVMKSENVERVEQGHRAPVDVEKIPGKG